MKKLLLALVVLVLVIGAALFIGIRVLLSPESVRSAVESQASAALGMPVKIRAAEVHVWPRAGLALDDVEIGAPVQVTLRRTVVSTALRALLSRRIEDAEVLVENSRVDLPKLLATLETLRRASATPDGAPSSGVTIVNVRTIGLRNVDLVVGDRQANVTLESSLAGDRLDITRLTAQADQTRAEATGAVESLARRVVRLSIDADPLDLDGLLRFAAAFSGAPAAASSAGGGPASGAGTGADGGGSAGAGPRADPSVPVDLQATVRAKTGRVAGLTFSNLTTTVVVTPTAVTLSPLALRVLGGYLDGNVTLALAGPTPELTMAGQVKGVDLQEVSAFAGQKTAITGTLDGRLQVTGRGLEPASALRTARGTADVSLAKGRIPGLELVRPIVLFFGRPQGTAVEGSGEAFERIAATVAIDRGEMRTGNLAFDSRDVDVDGAGTLSVTTGALDVRANLRLSEELSAQAGRDLVRYAREGDRVLLPATITGTVTAPHVMIDQQQALRRAIRNELQERTKSLFDRFLPGRKPQ